MKAAEVGQLQPLFQREPHLVEGRSVQEVIIDNIDKTSTGLRRRLGVEPCGFRTPGGFRTGLSDRPDLQELLLKRGFRWISSQYPGHRMRPQGKPPTEEVFQSIVEAQKSAQPFAYPTGLLEIPMSPISDIGAFRVGRWKLDHFLEAIRRGLDWAIENQAVYDFLGHPSCLLVTDPDFKAIDLICDQVEASGGAAVLSDLDEIARPFRADSGGAF